MEKEKGFRICSHCGEEMIEGYCIEGSEECFCSDECLREAYSEIRIENLGIGLEGSNSYWTTWYEDGE